MIATSTIRAVVSGRVQGVGFRMWTQRTAEQFGVSGWVRNLTDGTVEAVIAGRCDQIEAMLSALEQGPALSRVDGVKTFPVEQDEEAIGEEFEVRY